MDVQQEIHNATKSGRLLDFKRVSKLNISQHAKLVLDMAIAFWGYFLEKKWKLIDENGKKITRRKFLEELINKSIK